MHLDPSWHRQASLNVGIDEIESAVARALSVRLELEAFVVRDPKDAVRKAQLLARANEALEDAHLLGDLIVGAALAQREDSDPFAGTRAAAFVQTLSNPEAQALERDAARSSLRDLADDWLAERRRAVGHVAEVDFSDRDPFHWALEFPEVREQDGFDAIVGNPPFQGGRKISGALGGQYRDFLVTWIAGGARGGADLVAYFYLRAAALLRPAGVFGLIATNTIAQGDTREVGLDQLAAGEMTLFRGIPSRPWPGGANLEMATVWAQRGVWSGRYVLDGAEVGGITPSLAARSRVDGAAERLANNSRRAFIGSYQLGMGFVLSRDEAEKMVANDSRNADVLRPFLIGDDLNQRPDCSPSRWIIDFREWPEERAREYAEPFERLTRLVYPERANKDAAKYPRMVHEWWKYWNARPGLYRAIAPLSRCIAMTLHSKSVQPSLVPADFVFSHGLAIFAYDDDAHFGLLSSGFHWWWAVTHASTMRTDIRYTPTDCFETFARPDLTPDVADAGRALNEHRSALMLDRGEGVTATYNRFHDAHENAEDICQLRELHVELDSAVGDAYGWDDLELGHDFLDTRFGMRFTFESGVRQEVLDRLLELNQQRYAEEGRQGLHGRRKRTRQGATEEELTMELDGV
jgi:hypothetical protein